MDEINDQTESMKQIQEALSAPVGAAADFDEVLYLKFFSFCIWFYAILFLHLILCNSSIQ